MMKKTYQNPEITVEELQEEEMIAASEPQLGGEYDDNLILSRDDDYILGIWSESDYGIE